MNVHRIPTFELILLLQFFLENSENNSKLKDWIDFDIYWKNLLSHSRPWPWPWFCGLGLGLLTLALALTPLALLTSLKEIQSCDVEGVRVMQSRAGSVRRAACVRTADYVSSSGTRSPASVVWPHSPAPLARKVIRISSHRSDLTSSVHFCRGDANASLRTQQFDSGSDEHGEQRRYVIISAF